MATTTSLPQNAPDAGLRADRKRYNRQIWWGAAIILGLLVLLSLTIQSAFLRRFEPFLGLSIGLLITGVGSWLVIASHRDARAARGLSAALSTAAPRRAARLSFRLSLPAWEQVSLAAGAVLLVIVIAFTFVPVAQLLQTGIFWATGVVDIFHSNPSPLIHLR